MRKVSNYLIYLILLLMPCSAWSKFSCQSEECSDFLHTISGGSNIVLALEVLGVPMLVLYVLILIYDKSNK